MKTEHKVIGVSVLFGLLFWVVDALIDYLAFYEGTFWGLLITNVPPHEVYTRLTAIGLFVVFGILMSRVMGKLRQSREELRRSKEWSDTTLRSIGDGVIATDAKGLVTFVNTVAESLTGWEASEALHRPLKEVFHIVNEETGKEVENPVNRVLREGVVVGLANHTALISRDGTTRTIDDSGAPIMAEDGKILGTVLVFHDITDRRQAEEKLRETTEYLQSLIEYANAPIIVWDPDFRITRFNRAFENLTQRSADEVLGRPHDILFPEDRREEAMAHIRRASTGERWETVEIPIQRADGTVRTVLWNSATIYTDDGTTAVATIAQGTDITDRKRAEEALRESEERFRDVALSSADWIWEVDKNGKYTYASGKVEQVLGYNVDEMIGSTPFDFMPEEEAERIGKAFGRIASGKKPIVDLENWNLNRNGEKVCLLTNGVPMLDENGDLLGYRGVDKDITDRKRAEQVLRASEERLAVTLRSIGDAVIATDCDGNITLFNKVAEKLTGYSEKEAVGQPLGKVFYIINEITREKVEDPVAQVIKSGIVVGLANNTVLVSRDGKERIIADSGAPIRDRDGNLVGVVLVFRDITETRRLQEFAARAQRLETAGRIAGQVAHDFNNLLAPLMAYPPFIREAVPDDHEAVEFIDKIEKAADQMAEINQQLLTLGRRGHYAVEPVNMNDVVKHVIKQLKPMPDTLIIEANLSDQLMHIKGGPSQLYRVVDNLVSNALDSMKDIGRLTISTENYYVDVKSGRLSEIPKGEYVKLTIADTGCGIPQTVENKIFEPFFTTKTTDRMRGSGLGLSVVHAVVEDHHGCIDFETTTGKGTAFYLYFPITRESIDVNQRDSQILGGTETILIIDDDWTQRDVTVTLLEKLGYRATAVESGKEAVEFLKDRPQDLLVLDMIMPGGIDGAETYGRILEMYPRQKAIIVSGYAESDRVQQAVALGAGAFVRKPLTLKSLASAVRNELDKMTASKQ